MNEHSALRVFNFALKHGYARCDYCYGRITASDKVTVVGKQAKTIVHSECAILESEA